MTKFSQKLVSISILATFSLFGLFPNVSAAFPAGEKNTKNQVCDEKGKYPVCVNGGDIASFFPTSDKPIQNVVKKYDVVVVGGGLAGLMASVYLTERNKSVLLIEKENVLGGLAAGNNAGVRYDRGAAYFTDAYTEERELLKHVGLEKYEKYEIPEPIDSYFWNDKMYLHIWGEHTLHELPGSFDVFKIALQTADFFGEIPNQPFEDVDKYGGNLNLDRMNATEWIRSMPRITDDYIPRLTAEIEKLEARLVTLRKAPKKNEKKIEEVSERLETGKEYLTRARSSLRKFNEEFKAGKLEGTSGMDSVIGLTDLYCRSALGALTEQVSAVAFANFYISEIVARFTTPIGTGFASTTMENLLHQRNSLANIMTATTVKKITQDAKGVTVVYQNGDSNYAVQANYVVFSAQLGSAPKILEGFEQKAPEQAGLMKNLGYSHYSVHVVEVEGHPFRATYDTWTKAPDYTHDDFTDLILGRWMDPLMLGYNGYREFEADPPDNRGILSIYHPIATNRLKDYKDGEAMAVARTQVDRMEELFSRLPNTMWKGPLKIKKVETNRWPFSVHVAAPGHFSRKAKILRKPFGRVFFAHSNLGTPAFEEALFRGHCAANHIEEATNKAFKKERWSRCPSLAEIK